MLAVVGGKGGCGKTTTAACLARALAAAGTRPLLVDADVDMPDLHVVAGARPEPGLDALTGGASVEAVAQSPVELPGVRLVAGGTASIDDVGPALARLGSVAGPVIVDTAAGASPAVADPLRAVDAALVVTTPRRESLADAAKTAAMARALETPLVGSVVTASVGEVDPRPLLECPTLARVPAVERPTRDARVRDAHAAVASVLVERND